MKRGLLVMLLIGMLVAIPGCFSGRNFTPSKSECLYSCGKCGQSAFMMNSVLRSQSCPKGGTHDWRYNLR